MTVSLVWNLLGIVVVVVVNVVVAVVVVVVAISLDAAGVAVKYCIKPRKVKNC